LPRKEKINQTSKAGDPSLYCDTKIFAKILACQLKRVCRDVIGEEQLAYIEGRVLQDGHMVVNKVLELARKKKVVGLIGCIDFKGAFDQIRHQAIWDTLEHLNCGPNSMAHLKTLYNGATSSVLKFGYKTTFFDLMQSCRQGDPVAAYLFILVLEILLNRIRRLVKGLNLGSTEIVALAYADDLTIFVPNSKELEKAMCLIENFKAAAGLEVNKEKSEILELGTSSRLHGVPTKDTVKITGVHFCQDKSKMLKKKIEKKLLTE
jgi:hypothetical protein